VRFLKQLRRQQGQATPSESGPAIPASQTPTCDRCGKAVHFEGPESGTVVVTFGTPPMTRTLCAVCTVDEEKERQWRESGIWIGNDLPPSLKSMRPATPEELRKLRGEDD
jgi:hypothetical protein